MANAKYIWDFLMAEYKNPYGVAGLMGNLYAESGLNPKNLQNTFEKKLKMTDEAYTKAVDEGTYPNFIKDSAGYGLAQWTYSSRKLNLLTYAKHKNASIGNLTIQLEFLVKELAAYTAVVNVLKEATSVKQASDIVLTKYERPANQSDSVKETRARYGQRYYNDFVEKEETIMADYSKYISSTGTHYIANSGSDERKKYSGGAAGDQTGHEWELKAWYSRPWTHVFRYEKDPAVGIKLAELGCAAALNNNIGYDQYQRTTYWKQLQAVGYDPAKITVKCEEDCSAGTAANVKAAGYLLGIKALQDVSSSMTSRNTVSQLKAAGFTVLTASKYTASTSYLLPGDILLYENHHVAINVTKGKKATSIVVPVTPSKPAAALPIIGTAVAKATMFVRPSETSKSNYGTISKGKTVEVVELLASGWMKIVWPSAPEGYAYTSNKNNQYYTYTKLQVTETPANVMYKTTGRVNVRKKPGTSGQVIVTLPVNFKVNYTGKSENIQGVKWHYVTFVYNNKTYTGYISSKYLKKV